MFFELFFFQKKHQIGPVHFRPKKKQPHDKCWAWNFFSSWNLTGGPQGFSTCDRNFFFFLGRPIFFWSWHISGSFGQNFRVLMEETFARTGLIKKKKKRKKKKEKRKKRKQALHQAILMAQSLSLFLATRGRWWQDFSSFSYKLSINAVVGP